MFAPEDLGIGQGQPGMPLQKPGAFTAPMVKLSSPDFGVTLIVKILQRDVGQKLPDLFNIFYLSPFFLSEAVFTRRTSSLT